MPTYNYKCHKCGKETTKINRMSENKTGAPFCCSTQMKQTITPQTMGLEPMGAKEFQAYPCPHSGELVTSEKNRKAIMKKHDLIEAID